MGSKYTTLATSGYNSSPPPDDGTQTATNLITWDKHKTKLSDPVKTLADAMNTALVSAFDYSVRQISASDSTVLTDHMRCVEIAPGVSTAVTVSLGDAATMTTVYRVFVKNSCALLQTLGRVTGGDTIDGVAANISLAPGESRILQTNSTPNGYLTVGRFGPFVDTNPVAVGSLDGTKKVRLEVDGVTTVTTRVVTVPDRDITIGDLSSITNSISGDVTLNNTGTYFDGPTVAQGTSGTWLATGTVTVQDSAGAAAFIAKLWDGTTVIAVGQSESRTTNSAVAISVSGFISSPAGNIRISVKDLTSTSGSIIASKDSLGKSSTVTAVRVG